MNYYIKGNKERAEEIKAAFERLGYSTSLHTFFNEDTVFITLNGNICECNYGGAINELIKTHPDYKELELPVKSKFKVGDWVVKKDGETFYGGNYAEQITLIEVEESDKRIWFSSTTWLRENDIRLWSIADAKDGDVLVTTKIRSCPFIYRKTDYNNNLAYYYAGIDSNGDFCEGCLKKTLCHFGSVSDVIPATKEQRDLLFAKMKEAGYEWDDEKKELKKIINPNFKVGDEIKTGNTIDTVAEVDYATRRYYCESGRTIWFKNQDLWHLVPKLHYDISNFKPFDKVLTRDTEYGNWNVNLFSYYIDDKDARVIARFRCMNSLWSQCIPYNDDTKHLLGTTDMCDEQYINW